EAGREVVFDLLRQDQGVTHQDAGETYQAQYGVEAERLIEDDQHRNDSDEAKWGRQQDHRHRRERPNLQNDDDQHGSDHRGKNLDQRGVRLGSLFDRSARFYAVARRKGCNQRLKSIDDFFGHLGRLRRFVDLGTDRNDGYPVAALHDRVFQMDIRMTDLGKWNLLSGSTHQ